MEIPGFLRKFCVKKTAGVGRVAYTAALVMTGLFIMAVLTGRAAAGGQPGEEAPQIMKDADTDDNEIAARVNGVAITRAAVKTVAARMAGNGNAAAISKEALDRLVLAELACERAKASGITIAPADIDNAVNNIKGNAGGEDMFRRTLAEKKMTEEDLRKELERDLMIKRIYYKEVLAGIVINSEELNQEIEKARKELTKPGEKANMRAIRRSAEKKVKTREENKRREAWEADLRKKARIEIMEGGDETK